MKKIRKTIAVLLASVSVASTFSFASCDLLEGLLGNTGNSSTSSSISSATSVATVLEKLTSYQFKSLSLDGKYQEEWDYEEDYSYSYDKVELDIEGTVNIPSGDADIYWHYVQKLTGEDEEEQAEVCADYPIRVYSRDWISFVGDPSANDIYNHPESALYACPFGNVLDFINLNGLFDSEYGKYAIYACELLGYDVYGTSAEELVNTVFAFANAEIIAIADAAGAVTVKEGELVVDLNKAADTILQDIEDVIRSIKNSTTIVDLLKNSKVKKYGEALLRTAKADKVMSTFLKVYPLFKEDFKESFSLSMMEKIFKLISIHPDKNSTAYEYIVKIVSSKEFEEFLQTEICGGDFSLNAPILNYIEKDMIYEMLGIQNMSATEEEFDLFLTPENGIKVKNTEWTYSVENNCLKGLKFAAEVDCCLESGEKGMLRFEGKLDFSTQYSSLANIDNFQVVIDEVPLFEDGAFEASGYLETEEDFTFVGIFEQNELVDIQLSEEWEEKGFQCVYNAQENTLQIENINTGDLITCMAELETYYSELEISLYQEGQYVGYLSWYTDEQELIKKSIAECIQMIVGENS